jgi:3,4-dihydroxy 2-butanone 4-phosphate synthase/GTP cyclohydrolase II
MFAKSPKNTGSEASPSDIISPAKELIDDLAAGKMVILMDDEDRENEGDIVVAADKITAEHVNFMLKHARGLICLPMTESRLAALGLRMMVADNTAPLGTAFTVSIDARGCKGNGLSAADRAKTIRQAVSDDVDASDFVVPGHVFPLRARDGGVLVRTGQTARF